MYKEQLLDLIAKLGQPALKTGISLLSEDEISNFIEQIEKYEMYSSKQRESLFHNKKPISPIDPYQDVRHFGSQEDAKLGKTLMKQGKVGCVILAGGQGSRLGRLGPKGLTPVTPIRQKSLFQLFFEKVKAASCSFGCDLPLAVMTSPLNHKECLKYFEDNGWFGLKRQQVDLFEQNVMPLLDDRGNWALEAPGKLAVGSDGNGGVFKAFHDAGLFHKWQKNGVEYINIIQIENPLADPFDAELVGYHLRSGLEVTLKCVPRKHAEEKVGVVVKHKQEVRVVEYSELSVEEKKAVNSDGSLRFGIANIGLFCFSIPFIEKIIGAELPWHWARKQAPVLLQTSKGLFQDMAYAWKCETFIFDLLEYAKAVSVLLYPREKTFAPLKNKTGEASLETVQAALVDFDRAHYQDISGVVPPERTFELDPAFYYPTQELLELWKGKELPQQDYISEQL